MLKNGQVFVNSKKQTKFDFLLNKNDHIKIQLRKLNSFPYKILYEDESLIAIEKPAGVLTISTEQEKEKTAYKIVRNYLQKKGQKVFIVHRLDRDTSGILLFAKNEKMKIMLQKHWNDITLKNKEYSLLEVFLETGRKNQIRVHMSEAGHPIIGDTKYHATKNPIGRLGLHSHILEFIHPFSKKIISSETPIPDKFNKLLKHE